MFLEELNELFRENWLKFLTAGYVVFENTSRLPGKPSGKNMFISTRLHNGRFISQARRTRTSVQA